jgi:putative heme-binding domain-containing protein
MERANMLSAFGKSTDEAAGIALVSALAEPKVRAGIRAEQVKPILAKYPKAVQTEADKLYKLLDADRADMTKKLDTILTDTKPGDVRRGQAVFSSAKAACVACHNVGYVGGRIGPDLTKIGGIRSERDLLEAIVFPSASFVRSYEPVKVEMKNGKSYSGIVKQDAPDEIVLTVSATEEVRIARKEIDEMTPGTVSVMPAGLDQQLSKQDLADLLAFLRSLK